MQIKQIVLSCALSAIFLFKCSGARVAMHSSAHVPLLTDKIETIKNNIEPPDTLLLDNAISLALKNNLELRAFLTEIKAREALTLQESLLPNPELDIELENFAGSGSLGGVKGNETTLAIGQLIELGGKRAKRTQVAALQSDLALWRYEIARLNIVTNVRREYAQVFLAQEKLDLDRKLLALSGAFKANIDTLVLAGRLSQAESARAQVELSQRRLTLQRSQRELNNAQRRLTAIWGTGNVDFSVVKGSLTFIKSMPSADRVMQSLENSPALIEQKSIIAVQKTKTALAKALAIPDPVIRAGYRHFNETDDKAFVAGLSIPLTIFNRNQGGKEEAKLRELQAEQFYASLKNDVQTEVSNRLETIRTIAAEIEMIQEIIIPEAQKAYNIINQNYRLGKYALIDLLDAQRQLFDAQGRFLDALGEIKLEIIELEGRLGRSLDSL